LVSGWHVGLVLVAVPVLWALTIAALRPRRTRPVSLVCHRASSPQAPENTLAGVEYALHVSAAGLEIDIRATGDGVPVLHHDGNLRRMTGVDKAVGEAAWVEVASLTQSEPGKPSVPGLSRLSDVLEMGKDANCQLILEMKDPPLYPGLADTLVALIRRRGLATRPVLASFDQDWLLQRTERLSPVADLASIRVYPGSFAATEGFSQVHVAWARLFLDPTFIRRAHARGLEVVAWTVNDPVIARLMAWYGVDRITTDRYVQIRDALGL